MSYQQTTDADLAQGVKLQRRITSSAVAHSQAGDLTRAIETLELGLDQYPDNVYFLGQLGQLYRREGYLEDARHCFERSLALKPTDIRTATALAGVYADQDMLDRAEETLNHARQLDGTDLFVVVALARLLGERGRYEEAATLLRKSGGLENGNKYVIASFGVVQAVLGKRQEARDVLEQGHMMHPRDPYIINLLGILRGEMGDHAAAEEILQLGLRGDRRSRHIAASLATVFARQKKYGEAEQVAREALSYHPHDGVLLNILGNVYAQLGDITRAEDALLRARKNDPHNLAVITTLGHAYLKAGAHERFNALIEATGSQGSNDACYLYLMAKGALLQGNRADAAIAARKLVDLRGIDAQSAILYLACSDDAVASFTETFGEAGMADLKARAAEVVANPALIDLYDPKLRASDMLHYIGKALSDRVAAKKAERRMIRAASVMIVSLIVGATGLHFSSLPPIHSMMGATFTGAPASVWMTLVLALCCCTPDVPQSRRIAWALKGNR